MKPLMLVFAILSALAAPSLAMAHEFKNNVAGYDCADKLELATRKYAECAADVHSTQAAKNCATLVAMVYCKRLEASPSTQDKKLSLK